MEEAAGVLGVASTADLETLKAAYRQQALKWHPDKVRRERGREGRKEAGREVTCYMPVSMTKEGK
eukprot:evm.model.NODE_45696_length_6538_cov_7.355766.1